MTFSSDKSFKVEITNRLAAGHTKTELGTMGERNNKQHEEMNIPV